MAENNNIYTREELLYKGIYELRELGRDVGVPAPTTLKKEELVDKILAIIYGEQPRRKVGKGRGRPTRQTQKPCKLFVDMIEKLETPKVDSNFIYDENNNLKSYNFSPLLSSKVASPRQAYINDAIDSEGIIQKGVVCVQEDGIFVRKFRFIVSDDDFVLPFDVFDKYNIRDNDFIEFFVEDDKKTISQVFRINGNFAKIMHDKNGSSLKPIDLNIDESVLIKTNKSNVICAKEKEDRQRYFDLVSSVLNKLGFSLVRIMLDGDHLDVVEPKKVVDLKLSSPGDEYETMAIAEEGIERVRYFDRLGNKTALLIDNLNWLMDVASTYPKALYGNFLSKIGRMSISDKSSVTVVCIASTLSKEKLESVAEAFDNIVIYED